MACGRAHRLAKRRGVGFPHFHSAYYYYDKNLNLLSKKKTSIEYGGILMQITCDRTALTDALSVCIHAAASKSVIVALEGILMTTWEDTLTLCGFNTQMAIQIDIDAVCDAREKFVLPARIFFDIVRKLQGDEVTIKLDDKLNATISCGRAVFNLKADSSESFPEVPTVNRSRGVSIPSNLLRDMVNDTIFAISTNESKPVHTGTLFEVDDGLLTLVSVDGYRLAVRKEQIAAKTDEPFSFVVPGSTLKELVRILPDGDDPVTVYPEKKNGQFEFARTTVTTRLLEGEFINYRASIPNEMPIRMTINKNELIDAVERVSLIISERLKNPVRCLFEGDTLQLTCMTAMGRSFDEINIPFCPDRLEIGFNNRYLLDALRACQGDEVVLELKSGLSPCLFKPVEGDSYVYLVLPVRLKAEDL